MITESENARLPALDGLRGLAALAVVLFHLMQHSSPHSAPAIALRSVFATGWTGVDLFFVLSGFLITGLLLSAKGSSNYFRVFYARRTLRILPLYYAALIFLFGLPRIITFSSNLLVPLHDQLWFWFYLQNFHRLGGNFVGWTGPLWSLGIEEQFYLVWPLVILLASRKQAIGICIGLIAVGICYRIYAVSVVPHLDTYYVTQARLDGLAVGSSIALLIAEPHWLAKLRRLAPQVMIAATILFVISGTDFPVTGPVLSPLGHTSVAAFYGCLLVFALCATVSRLARVLKSPFLRFYGRYSYALYVIHVPAMSMLGHFDVSPDKLSIAGSDLAGQLLYIAIVTPIVTLLAWLSWHLFEKHFLKLKRYFVYHTSLTDLPPRTPGAPRKLING